jgi:hypothetical protein
MNSFELDPDDYATSFAIEQSKITFGDKATTYNRNVYYDIGIEKHKRLVRDAINSGLSIPDHVLKHYPDIFAEV